MKAVDWHLVFDFSIKVWANSNSQMGQDMPPPPPNPSLIYGIFISSGSHKCKTTMYIFSSFGTL